MSRSSRYRAPASWRCSSAWARPGSGTCSSRPAPARRRSCSSTRSTPSAPAATAATAASGAATSGSRPSTSCSPRWTDSRTPARSWCSPPPTGPPAAPASRVPVRGAGRALGLTEMPPADDRRLYGESYLSDTLAVRLGGRAAERLIRGEASTGAADDLASATALATQMVCDFGLSDSLGPVSYSGAPAGHPALGAQRSYSEHTQWLLDPEVAALLARAEARARDLLTRHREALTQLTAALLAQETISGDEVRALAAGVDLCALSAAHGHTPPSATRAPPHTAPRGAHRRP